MDSVMKLMDKMETLPVQDCTRYQYALAVKTFLVFCSQVDSLDRDKLQQIQKGIVRWDNARKSYQTGLTSARNVKKKEANC